MPFNKPENKYDCPICNSSVFRVPIVLKIYATIYNGFLKKDIKSGMHLEIDFWSASLLLLNNYDILCYIICKFLFPCKNGAKTPKKTILLTPLDLFMKLSKTKSSFSAW